MLRKKVILIVVILIVFAWSLYRYAISQRPTDEDFVIFMEEKYDIKCNESSCTSFNITVMENGEEHEILMVAHSGRGSTRAMTYTLENNYFSEPTSKYYLRLTVKGFLGEFKVIEESKNF